MLREIEISCIMPSRTPPPGDESTECDTPPRQRNVLSALSPAYYPIASVHAPVARRGNTPTQCSDCHGHETRMSEITPTRSENYSFPLRCVTGELPYEEGIHASHQQIWKYVVYNPETNEKRLVVIKRYQTDTCVVDTYPLNTQ